jgi:hypothetical protein
MARSSGRFPSAVRRRNDAAMLGRSPRQCLPGARAVAHSFSRTSAQGLVADYLRANSAEVERDHACHKPSMARIAKPELRHITEDSY